MKRKSAEEMRAEMTDQEFLQLIKKVLEEDNFPYGETPTPLRTTARDIMKVVMEGDKNDRN